ncbi:MAG TPA: DUF6325 family protein [Nakamurella sp.]|nr:DUF6325 family protein [Nakamurella sp.]
MEIGPVDVLVVAFPGNQFNGAILPALSDLVGAGTVRLLDLLFVYKDADGTVGALELNDIAAQFGSVPLAEDSAGGLLDAEDVEEVAAGLQPNSSVALLCWENSWAAPFVAALEGSGAQLLDQARIPREAVLSALAAVSQS